MYYLFVFTKTSDTVKAYEKACALYSKQNVTIMPIPNQIDESCGLAVSIHDLDICEQVRFLAGLDTPASLFKVDVDIDKKGSKGIQAAVKVGQNQIGAP